MKICHSQVTFQNSRANSIWAFMHLLLAPKLSLSELESWSITVYLKATFTLVQSSTGHQILEIFLPLRQFKEKLFVSLQGPNTMRIQTLCSKSTKFSSLVTLSNLINQFLFDSSRIENFQNHSTAFFKISLSMSKSLVMMITILESKQILHCSTFQVVRLSAAGTKTTFHWNQKQIQQHLKRTSSVKSLTHTTKSVQSLTALPANPRTKNSKDNKPSSKTLLFLLHHPHLILKSFSHAY